MTTAAQARVADARNDLEYQLATDIAALGKRMVALDAAMRSAMDEGRWDTAGEMMRLRLDAQQHRSDLMVEAFAWRQRRRWA